MSDFGELHGELRSVARDLLGKASAPDWRVVADAGWLGLDLPDDLGGAGATFAEVAVVLEEMGRAATSSPYLGTAVLGVGALGLLEPTPGRDDLLRRAAAGDLRLAVALPTGDDPTVPFHVDGGRRLHGRAEFVPDAPDADVLLLLTLDTDGTPVVAPAPAEAGPQPAPDATRRFTTAGPAAGAVEVTPQPVLDATRQFGVVVAEGAEVDEVWRFAGDPARAARRLYDRAALAVACDSLGLSEAMLDATVAYAKVRQQFGRPIGSFQAVKHACADMLVQVSVARELVATALAGDHTPEAVSMAKSYVCAAAVDVVGRALQLHGGIGYTWESGIHAYLKRAALNRSLFGSPRAHRRRLAERYALR